MLLMTCAATQEIREVTSTGFLGDYSMLQPGRMDCPFGNSI